jgi:hypothetical protein
VMMSNAILMSAFGRHEADMANRSPHVRCWEKSGPSNRTARLPLMTRNGSPGLSRLGHCPIGEPRQQLLNLTRIVAQANPLAVQ